MHQASRQQMRGTSSIVRASLDARGVCSVEYRLLGGTGMRVSPLCLGSVFFGTAVPQPEADRIVCTALDHGINFVDTAEIYQRPAYGAAEESVGLALRGRRHAVVLATKKRYDPRQFRSGGPSDHGLSRHHIVTAVEQSLRRLRTDYLDLYYPHHVDPDTSLEESLRAFDDLVRAGKVHYIHVSIGCDLSRVRGLCGQGLAFQQSHHVFLSSPRRC